VPSIAGCCCLFGSVVIREVVSVSAVAVPTANVSRTTAAISTSMTRHAHLIAYRPLVPVAPRPQLWLWRSPIRSVAGICRPLFVYTAWGGTQSGGGPGARMRTVAAHDDSMLETLCSRHGETERPRSPSPRPLPILGLAAPRRLALAVVSFQACRLGRACTQSSICFYPAELHPNPQRMLDLNASEPRLEPTRTARLASFRAPGTISAPELVSPFTSSAIGAAVSGCQGEYARASEGAEADVAGRVPCFAGVAVVE
jgi:hypothetical protein